MYFNRRIDEKLTLWLKATHRKPLLLRGARQIGKTTSVRELARREKKQLVEIDCDRRKDLHSLFARKERSIRDLISDLSALLNVDITPGKTLLFFDEIQACPEAIELLRYFYEEIPQLHVVATGSLLEFALKDIGNFGVGRVESLFMYPLSFNEFLEALGEKRLLKAIQSASPTKPLNEALHKKAIDWMHLFFLLGGMPEVIKLYVESRDLRACENLLNDLVLNFEDDFTKYKKRASPLLLREVFQAVATQSEGKFVYQHVNPALRVETIKEALELLLLAGLLIPVTHSSGNGIPLAKEANEKKRRIHYFDTGILCRMLSVHLTDFIQGRLDDFIGKGAAAETFVATELMKATPVKERAMLYYWHNEGKNTNAEVDFLTTINQKVFPIEVKAGRKSAMRSMWVYLDKKKDRPAVAHQGIRLSLENFSQIEKIDILPLYAAGSLDELYGSTK